MAGFGLARQLPGLDGAVGGQDNGLCRWLLARKIGFTRIEIQLVAIQY